MVFLAYRIRISAYFTWINNSYLTAVTSKNDVTLCKLDVNVKNRTAVAGSVDFFKVE